VRARGARPSRPDKKSYLQKFCQRGIGIRLLSTGFVSLRNTGGPGLVGGARMPKKRVRVAGFAGL